MVRSHVYENIVQYFCELVLLFILLFVFNQSRPDVYNTKGKLTKLKGIVDFSGFRLSIEIEKA